MKDAHQQETVTISFRVELPLGLRAHHAREYVAAFIEDRDAVLLDEQIDALREVKAQVLDTSAGLFLGAEECARLRNLAGDGTECTAGRIESMPLTGELEFNGVPLSKMPYDRLVQSMHDVMRELGRRGAHGEVNLTHPAPSVKHAEMRVTYKG